MAKDVSNYSLATSVAYHKKENLQSLPNFTDFALDVPT